MSQHHIGDAVRLWVAFRDQSGNQADPTSVLLYVKHPDGEVESISTSSASAGEVSLAATATGQTLSGTTGIYKATVTPDEAGWWKYRWIGTGAVVEVAPDWFAVPRDEVGSPS